MSDIYIIKYLSCMLLAAYNLYTAKVKDFKKLAFSPLKFFI